MTNVARRSSSRKPTEKQARKLRVLAGGCIAVAPYRSEWMPLARRGWIESATDEVIVDGKGLDRFLPPLRITPDGLRALAAATEAGVIDPVTLKARP